jgi:hypothetical protein
MRREGGTPCAECGGVEQRFINNIPIKGGVVE